MFCVYRVIVCIRSGDVLILGSFEPYPRVIRDINPGHAEIFLRSKVFSQFEIVINVLASSFCLFEYICIGSTAIKNILILSVP